MMENVKYAIVDIETTGHSYRNGDRIIQIAIVIMQRWRIMETFTTFIHPGCPIPLFIQDLTNITDEDVKDAEQFEHYAHIIYGLLQDAVFVAHNADFDYVFLQNALKAAGLPTLKVKKIDTVELCKIVFPTAVSYKLGDITQELHIPLQQAHRADEDALATAHLLRYCYEQLLTYPQVTLEQLHRRSFLLKTDLSHLLFAAVTEKRKTVTKDRAHIYTHGLAVKAPQLLEEQESNLLSYPVTKEEKTALISNAFKSFEERPQQYEMMDIVWQALQKKKQLMIEASTGIGKTLGYLLPVFYYAKATGEKVVISTYTSNLLDQLMEDDLKKLYDITEEHLPVALLKGMANYIDIERFSKMLKVEDDSYDETLAICQTLTWLSQTMTGDVTELNMSGGGSLFLKKIRKKAHHQTNDFDFYEYALQKSKGAKIILTNHAMLVADHKRHTSLFHEIQHFVIDEAHQLAQAAIQQDEIIFTYTSWKYLFGQMATLEDEALLKKFYTLAKNSERIPLAIVRNVERFLMEIVYQFDALINTFINQVPTSYKKETKQTIPLSALSIANEKVAQIAKVMQKLVEEMEQALKFFYMYSDEVETKQQFIIDEWQYYIYEWTEKIGEWQALFADLNEEESAWLELDRRSIPGSIRIVKKPLFIGEKLTNLFTSRENKAGVIWTSGTLTVPHNERFIARQMGVRDDIPLYQLQAPASYYTGAKCYIVTDLPDVQSVAQNDFIEEVAYAITRTVRTTEGRCFVLFTAQDMLKKTVALIQESQLLEDYMLFAQGVTQGSRMRLVKSFQKFNRSVLFGTNSFWEGVDVPGDGLATVIIVRLPFSAPNEPTFKAKSLYCQQLGYNAFTELALPEAIIRFKQGFGRLIRSSGDRGALIVLDRRIDTKSYGQQFLDSLPPISIEKLSLEHMVQALGNWYNNRHE